MLTSLRIAGLLNQLGDLQSPRKDKDRCSQVDGDDLKPCADDSFSRASTADTQVSEGDREFVERQMCSVIGNMEAAVSLADPEDPGHTLKMVSKGFEAMTGFQKMVACGKNCRFMTYECHNDPEQLASLRSASKTGEPTTVVLENRKATGEKFLHCIHVQGMCVATDNLEGQDMWYLIGIHIDLVDGDATVVPQEAIRKTMAEVHSRVVAALKSAVPAQGLKAHGAKSAVQVFQRPLWMGGGESSDDDYSDTHDSDFDEE